MSDNVHYVYLVPGMFGFGELAGYYYFVHLERALSTRFGNAGVELRLHVVSTPPTASIRHRGRVLAETVASTFHNDGPIHFLGHSTGGLDGRLVASPNAALGIDNDKLEWLPRLTSVVTMNTPHHGTPLAQFFTTAAGARLLHALSLLTFTTFRYAGPPLTALSGVIAAIGSVDAAIGSDILPVDKAANLLLRFIGNEGRQEVSKWLDSIRQDQSGIIQITPECMDIFNATVRNAAHVRYGSVVSVAPAPHPLRLAAKVRSPSTVLSATLYTTLYAVAARPSTSYPCPPATGANARRLNAGINALVDESHCDGVVPTLNMLWGELLWAGPGDHLDVVGHFQDNQDRKEPTTHTDWLTSGAHFGRGEFGAAMDAVAAFLLRSPTSEEEEDHVGTDNRAARRRCPEGTGLGSSPDRRAPDPME